MISRICQKVGIGLGLFIISLGLFIGCDQSDNPATSNQPSTIQGRVAGGPGTSTMSKNMMNTTQSIEGATVTIAQVQANGSLSAVSTSSVQTDAQGNFHVETDLDGESNLVVIATKNNQTWKAVVSAVVHHGTTVYSRPLDLESTVEAEIYSNVVARGDTDVVTTSDISLLVTADVAAQVTDNSAQQNALALAIIAEAEARVTAMQHDSMNLSDAQVQAVINGEIKAEQNLERNLYFAGTNTVAISAAYNTYSDEMVNAFSQTTLKLESYVKSLEIAKSAMIKASGSLSSGIKFDMEKQISIASANALELALNAEFSKISASQTTMTNIGNASAQLQANLEAATDTAQIHAALELYHDVIVSQLSATISSYSSVIVSIDGSINNNNNGERHMLEIHLNSALTTNAVIDAYMSFYDNVENSITVSMNNASQNQISTTSQILILVNQQV